MLKITNCDSKTLPKTHSKKGLYTTSTSIAKSKFDLDYSTQVVLNLDLELDLNIEIGIEYDSNLDIFTTATPTRSVICLAVAKPVSCSRLCVLLLASSW